MPRVVSKPFDTAAVKGASNTFYNLHPEMVKDGKRVPLDPCDPKQAAMQKEWMDLYEAYGGKTQKGTVDRKCGECVEKCECSTGHLHVLVWVDGEPLPENMLVVIYGPTRREGSTNKTGEVLFYGLEPGKYTIEAYEETTIVTEETVRMEKEIKEHQDEIRWHNKRIEHDMSWVDPKDKNSGSPFLDTVVKILAWIGENMSGAPSAPGAAPMEPFIESQEKNIDEIAKERARGRIEVHEREIGRNQSQIERLNKEIRDIKSRRVGTGEATVSPCATAKADIQIG
jgi:hypothetical protein